MSSSPLPVILIGCGAVAQQFYLPALRTLGRAGVLNVHALVDPTETARSVLARAFPQAQAVSKLEEVAAPEGSLAIVASPPRFHAPQTISAFERDWHVLCEKPMASSAAEAETMVAAAQRSGCLLAVGLYKRFFPSSGYLRTLCRDELLGPLKSFTIREGGPFRWPAASKSFFDKIQTPGGVLLDIGVHVIDLIAWWLGEPLALHYADDAMGGLETNAFVQLTYPGNVRGQLHFSRDWATAQRYDFVFERGAVSWKVNDANGLTVQLAGAPAALQAALIAPDSQKALASNAQSFIAQLQNVAAAIAGHAELLVPGEEGLRSLQLIEQCYAQRTLLDQPWLTPAESSRARELATLPLTVS